MRDEQKVRKFEWLVGDHWRPIKFEELRDGDTFRVVGDESYSMVADGDPYHDPKALLPGPNTVLSIMLPRKEVRATEEE